MAALRGQGDPGTAGNQRNTDTTAEITLPLGNGTSHDGQWHDALGGSAIEAQGDKLTASIEPRGAAWFVRA